MKKLIKFFYAFIALSIFGLVSCRNTNDPDPEPVPIPPDPVIVRELVGIEVQKVGLDKFLTTDDVFDFVYIKVILKYDDGTTSEVLLDDINDLPADWEIDYAAFTENLKKDEAERVTPEGEGLEIDVFYQKDVNTRLKATYKISVIAPPDPASAKRIEVYAPPTKLEYGHLVEEDKELNTQGLIMKVIYEEADPNAEPPVEEDFLLRYPYIETDPWKFVGFSNTDPQNDDKLQSIAVRYALDPTTYDETDDTTYIELQDAFEVDVVTQVVGFNIAAEPNKVNYLIGENFTSEGLKLQFEMSNPDKTDTCTDFTNTDEWEFVGFDSTEKAWKQKVEVRQLEGDTIKNKTTLEVYILGIDNMTLPADLEDPNNPNLIFFATEDIAFFNEEFIKDSNTVYIHASVANPEDDADIVNEVINMPITDPRIKISLSGEGIDTDNEVFVVPPNKSDSIVIGTVNFHAKTVDIINATSSIGFKVLRKFEFTDEIKVADKTYVLSKVNKEVLEIDEKLDGTNTPYSEYGQTSFKYLDGTETVAPEYKQEMENGYMKTFVTYGYYPQTMKDDDITVFTSPRRTITRGGFTMYLGSDGCYYVSQKIEYMNTYNDGADDGQYKFRNGDEIKNINGETKYFKVEPIIWRILDNDYKGESASLLWSVLALDRISYYDDGNNPNDFLQLPKTETNKNKDKSDAGKSDRETIKWYEYKYSTIRAYLKGEYATGDTQGESYFDDYLNCIAEGNGFTQRAFNSENKLKTVTIDGELNDSVFLLSTDELSNPDYLFIKDMGNGADVSAEVYKELSEYRQKQTTKQLTDFALARGGKRWSNNQVGGTSIEGMPGTEFWTRTVTNNSVRMVAGTGRVYGSAPKSGGGRESKNILVGRGAYPACTMIPAITLDNTKFNLE